MIVGPGSHTVAGFGDQLQWGKKTPIDTRGGMVFP